MKRILLILFTISFVSVFAGNKDRIGEAGAPELVMNGWARSTGVWDLNTARVMGIEAMRLNPAGVSFTPKMQISLAQTFWWAGSGVSLSQLGFASKLGKKNVVGVSLMSLNLGKIYRTTENNPDPNNSLGTYSPSFFNIGLTFSRAFSERIRAGATARVITQSAEGVSAFGFALDAGIQYLLGKKENLRFGISVRNLGIPMRFRGQGFDYRTAEPDAGDYQITVAKNSSGFQLPALLTLGASYDFWLGNTFTKNGGYNMHRVSLLGSYIVNAYGKDNFGLGAEYAFKEMFMMRAAYRYEDGNHTKNQTSIYSGLSAGLSVDVPFKENGPRLAVDYSYRHTNNLAGTHSVGLTFNLAGKEKEEKEDVKASKPAKKEKKKKKKKEEPKEEVEQVVETVIDTLVVYKEAELKDSDNDGLPDKYDLCPNEKGELRYGGCKAPEKVITEKEKAKIKAISSGINFDTNGGKLTVEAKKELDRLVSLLKDKKNAYIRIDAHTDSRGTDDYNILLSYKRGKTVKDYLVAKGIAKDRVVFEVHGEKDPIATNDTEAGRAKNRRVEITIR